MKQVVEIEGMDKLNALFSGMPKEVSDSVERELKIVCADLQGKAQNLAPVDTGDLIGSAYNEVKVLDGEVGFTEPYALRQHEQTGYKHPHGGQAKFLEQPYKENRDDYVKNIGDTVKKAVKG